MSFIYDLPFHNNPYYAQHLTKKYGNKMYSVYFGMPSLGIPDARIQDEPLDVDDLICNLLMLPEHTKKYVTMNGRYTPFMNYDKDRLSKVVDVFRKMFEANVLDGLLYLDFYYLRMLAEVDPELFSKLEAVSSINCYLDNIEKFNSHLVYINDIGMKQPSKLIFDRSLNRRMDGLAQLSKEVKKKHPQMKIELLVNEGCLYQCPFKVNHDIAISMVNDVSFLGQQYLSHQMSDNSFDLGALNEEWGCIRHLDEKPSRMFQIPFIRPEDLDKYEDLFDIVKISGKVLPDQTVYNIIDAYERREWDGNLLGILDATGALRDNYYIFNDEIPDNFHKMLTTCDKNCMKCKYCEVVADKTMQSTEKRVVPSEELQFCPSSSV
jgi:hypothetical protein